MDSAPSSERARFGRILRAEGISHCAPEAGRDRQTLAPLTRSFAPGALHVIPGPLAESHTALLAILALTLRPTRGALWWGEVGLTSLPIPSQEKWRRAHIGLITPTTRLVSVMTVGEHVSMAKPEKTAASGPAQHVIQLGLAARLGALPEELSEEERRGVAIAQVLSASKPVLLAADPTAQFDRNGAARVAATLRDFARLTDAVVICASEDIALRDAADELLILEEAQ